VLTLLAHAAPFTYKFPLPIWMYVLAGGAAVLLSAPAAALAVTDEPPREHRTRNIYGWARRLRLAPIFIALFTAIFIWSLIGGIFATTAQSQEFLENPITVVTWA
jgi:hypothetical protein